MNPLENHPLSQHCWDWNWETAGDWWTIIDQLISRYWSGRSTGAGQWITGTTVTHDAHGSHLQTMTTWIQIFYFSLWGQKIEFLLLLILLLILFLIVRDPPSLSVQLLTGSRIQHWNFIFPEKRLQKTWFKIKNKNNDKEEYRQDKHNSPKSELSLWTNQDRGERPLLSRAWVAVSSFSLVK